MDNYERSKEYARTLFLKWDQKKLLRRCGLSADDEAIQISFLGRPFRLLRKSGEVENLADRRAANFSEALTIYDYLCRDNPIPGMSGKLRAVNALPHVVQTAAPNPVSLYQKWAERFQNQQAELAAAIKALGYAPFPQGDIACSFPVFDGFNAVFQFWAGDEEFPPSVRFLWDENSLSYLKYETLYYAMGSLLELLGETIDEKIVKD